MLKYRLLYGVLFAALLVGVFYLDSLLAARWQAQEPWSLPAGSMLALLCALILPLALLEMQGLLARENVQISMRICVVAALLCMTWPWIEQVAHNAESLPAHANWNRIAGMFRTVKPHYLVPTVLAASLVGAFVMHTRHRKIDGAMANAGATLLATVYLGVLPGFYLPICLTHSSWMVLAVIAIVKSADIGAYATGHLIGRHKLIGWLSPGKTIEGFVGGLVVSAAVGATSAALWSGFHWAEGLAAGLVLGAVGQLGDLVESLLKRDAGVKDSGLVPGFGGILDLLDSPLLAAPVAYWMLKLMG